jgi:hypothetical protein
VDEWSRTSGTITGLADEGDRTTGAKEKGGTADLTDGRLLIPVMIFEPDESNFTNRTRSLSDEVVSERNGCDDCLQSQKCSSLQVAIRIK